MGMNDNYPPGTWAGDPNAPWNQEEPIGCSECRHWRSDDGEYGICTKGAEEADNDFRFCRRVPIGNGQFRTFTDYSYVLDWAAGHITPAEYMCDDAEE